MNLRASIVLLFSLALCANAANYNFDFVKGKVIAGDKDGVANLLDNGADVNMVGPICKQSLLQWAVRKDQTDMVKMLLQRGADPNFQRKDNKMTALMVAAEMNKPEIAKILINNNADKGLKDMKGRTARDIAEEKEFDTMVEIF